MRVIFPRQEKEGTHITVYPDERRFFSNMEQVGSNLIADYRGAILLTKYVPETSICNIVFWDRFTDDEKENLLDAANKKIKAFLYELRIRPAFRLNSTKVITAINALESAGIIGVGRADEILAI